MAAAQGCLRSCLARCAHTRPPLPAGGNGGSASGTGSATGGDGGGLIVLAVFRQSGLAFACFCCWRSNRTLRHLAIGPPLLPLPSLPTGNGGGGGGCTGSGCTGGNGGGQCCAHDSCACHVAGSTAAPAAVGAAHAQDCASPHRPPALLPLAQAMVATAAMQPPPPTTTATTALTVRQRRPAVPAAARPAAATAQPTLSTPACC